MKLKLLIECLPILPKASPGSSSEASHSGSRYMWPLKSSNAVETPFERIIDPSVCARTSRCKTHYSEQIQELILSY